MTATNMLPSHGRGCARAGILPNKENTMTQNDNDALTPQDYPLLASKGFITFRLRPGMTRQRLNRSLRRQEKILRAFGYRASHTEAPCNRDTRCDQCNYCIISGITDGKAYKPFYHWCSEMGQPVCPGGWCPRGRNGWGPVIQVLRGDMRSLPSSRTAS